MRYDNARPIVFQGWRVVQGDQRCEEVMIITNMFKLPLGHVMDTVPSLLSSINYLSPSGENCYFPYFTDVETEAQRGKMLIQLVSHRAGIQAGVACLHVLLITLLY